MSKFIKLLVVGFAVLTGVGGMGASKAEAGHGFYSKPTVHRNHQTRDYSYFSKQNNSYRHHTAFYFNHRPKHVFFFNPHKKVFWGRFDLTTGGYSLLAAKDQKETLDEIRESAFPKAGALPAEEFGGDTLLAPPEYTAPVKVQTPTIIVITVPGTTPKATAYPKH